MALKRRLSTLDAGFLYGERPDQTMHVGGCMVYDGPISLEQLTEIVQQRLHLIPRYRQRVVFPPFSAAHPTWEDDPEFDLRNHLEERVLPAPGDDRALSEYGGQLYSTMLDRNHPLWKLILLQGRTDGCSALLWKVHHAMVDGVSSIELTMTLNDLTPNAAPPEPPAEQWQPKALPDQISLLQDAVRDQAVAAAERWAEESFQWLRPAELRERTQRVTAALRASMPTMMRPAPPAPFNGPITARRQFAWAIFSFPEIRYVKSILGGTVNDLVLAILSGAIGRYLRAHNLPTAGVELRAMCPVSMRRPDQQDALGNLVSSIIVPLFVGIDDPVERLQAERAAMNLLKEQDQAGAFFSLSNLGDRVPAALQAFAGQSATSQSLVNTVSTNVPGPQIPLYLAGRRMVSMYPLGIVSANIGLFNAILTYDQQLCFGCTVDPTLMPDVWMFTDCLKESFAELRDAANQRAPAGSMSPAPVQVRPNTGRPVAAG